MTKSVLFAILIIGARDITFFNSDAGQDRRNGENALIYIMYTRGLKKKKLKADTKK